MKTVLILIALGTFGFSQGAFAQNNSGSLDMNSILLSTITQSTAPNAPPVANPQSVCIDCGGARPARCCCNISNGHATDCSYNPSSIQ